MRDIDRYFHDRAPHTLYHYTSIDSLLEIVKGRNVRASHIYYVNDSTEITHASDALIHALSKVRTRAHGDEARFASQLEKWLWSFRETPYHIFAFSLSAHSSKLSQWRSYTPHGKGVSIGFSPETLARMTRQGYRLAKCVYDSTAKMDMLQGIYERMLTSYEQARESFDRSPGAAGQELFPFFEQYREAMLQLFAVVKHPEFVEEDEWRIISPYFPKYTVKDIKFCAGSSMLTPFIEIGLPEADTNQRAFEVVVLGPTQHNNLSHSALSSYLSNMQACNTVVSCGIPYRKWT